MTIKSAPRVSAAARGPAGLRIAVLHSTFNAPVVDGLRDGALQALAGAEVTLVDVPGAFELPLAAQAAARSGRFDAVVALGSR